MSKADQLRQSAAFGRASTARSSRRGLIDNAIHGDRAATAAITDLPVTQISDNPENPRNHLRNLDETVESVREVGVILPIVVGTVDAYLRDRAHRAGDLDDGAQYVVIDGHRRLEAARRVGLATIPVRVDDARLSTDEKLLESAFIANYHREGMTDLEEAHALKQLVDYYGSQAKACKRLSIAPATLSSKLSLLKLSPELQKDLMTGKRTAEHVRNLGKLPPAAQKAKADERAAAARQRSAGRKAIAVHPEEQPADFHGVKSNDSVTRDAGQATATAAPPAAPAPGQTSPPSEAIPEPRAVSENEEGAESNDGSQPRQLPYDDAPFIAHHLHRKMEPAVFAQCASVLLGILQEHHPDEYRALLHQLTEQKQPA